jgi:hypothetical protein
MELQQMYEDLFLAAQAYMGWTDSETETAYHIMTQGIVR